MMAQKRLDITAPGAVTASMAEVHSRSCHEIGCFTMDGSRDIRRDP